MPRHQGDYSEGLSPEAMPSLQLRLDLFADMRTLDQAGQLDADDKARVRQLALEIGAAGRLLATKEIDEVLPLEDRQAHKDAKPEVEYGEVIFDPAKLEARQKAMVAKLPKEGLAVVILGGMHDLGPHLPVGSLYVRVTPQSYPVD